MADTNNATQDNSQWTVTQVTGDDGSVVEGAVEPVFVAMQPVVGDGQVEVQEVVIVTEGGEEVTEVVQGTVGDEYDIKAGDIVSSVGEEVIAEHFVQVPQYTVFQEDRKPLIYSHESVPRRSPGRPSRGRPPGRPPKTHFTYRPQPKIEKESEDDDFPAPARMSTPHFPRSRGGKSLSRIPKVEPPIPSSSETDSDSDSEVRFHSSYMNQEYQKKKPKPREFAHRLQWRNRDMLEAMKAVEEQKMTIRGAAKKFNVPYSTLKDRVHGRVRHGAKPGVKTILSPEEEEELAKFVRDMENAGFQLRCIDVRDRAAELLRLNHGHNSPYKEGSPGHNWFHGFVKRHPGLEFKRTVKKNIVPSISKQKHMLRRFYDITANIYKKYKLSHKSDRIFSVSELRLGGHFEATILYASSANGSMIPPFVIFKGNALKLTSARQEYPEAFFTCSYDGRVNEDIFLWWFRDHFLKKVPTSPARPGILFISRAVNDITIQTVQLAKDERMNLVGMTFGISHLVQPLDDDVSDMIRSSFNRRFSKWQDENPAVPVTQKIVAQILRKVWMKIDPEDVAAKFCANGIYPLNAYAITQDKLLTGAHILREMVERSPPRQPSGSGQLSGLNLLSALSSQEYATLDYGNRDYSGNNNQSFETQSDTSINESIRSNDREKEGNQGYKVVIKSQPGKENEVMVVPMNESTEEGNVVQEQVEVSSEIVETEVISEPTEEQVQELMETQRELRRKRPRPRTDILEREVDVRNEIIAARENEDQINKAIDSILDKKPDSEPPDIVSNIKMERTSSPVPKRLKTITSIPNVSTTETSQSPTTSIQIAPDKIKEEITKAIQKGSFGGYDSLKLSDFQGNDIKIQIRIQNVDEPILKPSTSKQQIQIKPKISKPQVKYVTKAAATEAAVRSAGGFIKVSDPSRKRQNFVIQSSQIKARTEDFSPIIKSVETVQAELPSQILDIEEDPTVGMTSQEVVTSEDVVVMTTADGEQLYTSDGQPFVLPTDSNAISSEGTTEVITEDGQRIFVTSHELVSSPTVEVEEQLEEVEEEPEQQQCVVQYVNEHGEIIEVKEVMSMHG